MTKLLKIIRKMNPDWTKLYKEINDWCQPSCNMRAHSIARKPRAKRNRNRNQPDLLPATQKFAKQNLESAWFLMYKQLTEVQIQANSHSNICLPLTYANHTEEKINRNIVNMKPILFAFFPTTLLEWATKADETGNEAPSSLGLRFLRGSARMQ